MNTNELMHHGIPGMKWGFRTAVSKSSGESSNKKTKSLLTKADRAVRTKRKKDSKNRRLLTDKQLTAKIARLEKEKKLRELTESEIYPGKKATADVMKNVGSRVAGTVLTGAALYATKAALTKKVDLKDLASYVAPKPGKK